MRVRYLPEEGIIEVLREIVGEQRTERRGFGRESTVEGADPVI